VLWRQKEQFSDGVGYDWVDGLKEYAEQMVSDEDFKKRKTRFPYNPPETKEYYLLRTYFDKFFPGESPLLTVPTGKSIACSTPEAICWDPAWEKSTGDISGRAVDVHTQSGEFDLMGSSLDLDESSSDATPTGASDNGAKAPTTACAAGAGGWKRSTAALPPPPAFGAAAFTVRRPLGRATTAAVRVAAASRSVRSVVMRAPPPRAAATAAAKAAVSMAAAGRTLFA
jgi:hypothetical protein